MAHSIAWSTLRIATKGEDGRSYLVRRFQFMPDDLDDKVREGIIELQLDSEKSHKQYLRMTLKRILDCVDMKYLTMIVFTDEDQVAMKPYTKEVVEAFTLKLCE